MGETTIVLAEDHQIVRQGLRALLEPEADFQIVGEASDGSEALQLAERVRPDVMIVDLMMPGLNGLEVTHQVARRSPKTRVIILSAFDNEAYVTEALGNGAAGYVLKKSSAADLVQAVREVITGRRYLSPTLSERAIEAYVRFIQEVRDSALDLYETLTPREREVLHLAAEGYTNAEIAARLSISRRTVETHRANMMRKLGLRTPTDLIRYAVQRGILPA
jgi:two-component system response regulator NreC